ncbi:GntP family permease [Acinetobacter rudis]|uniref:GntP family permease n=1 Tax=Acinetobacter rudis TaxID=632955 RepID=A0AAW8JEI8_9GAMM|nr:GntP family permease [Acinetobacter rudis]MDQ8936069.1 GntP family permease [Acinetobacter rudis]MDQ9018332.1 GntP family permease [Acinetobacter rudis]
MIGLIGIILSLVLLMYLAYKGFSVIILAPLLALFAVLWSGLSHEILGVYSQIFMTGLGSYVIKYFPLFLLGAIFGKLMDDSGSAGTIANFFVNKLGHKRAMLSIVLSCAILTYGGVSLFVVGFAVFPIAAALFKELGIPKRLIPAAIVLGALTFTMTALPGTPAIQNAIPMPFFNTDLYAAPGLGIISSIFILITGMYWLNYRSKRAHEQQEGYGQHHEPEFQISSGHQGPSLTIAMLPIIVVIITNLVLTKWILPSLDTAYLATDKFGHASLSSVIGLWAIICALVLACLTIILLNWQRIANIKDSLQQGVSSSFLPIFNTASEVGYGSVIASLAGFIILRDFLIGLAPSNPLISEAIVINVLAGITGSASGGLSIALNTMGETYMNLAQQHGISPELMHRVASMASGALDSLPHNGAVITIITLCGLTHKQSYYDMFIVAVIIPLMALIGVITLGTMFGSF